jgi:NAD-specific glutamate dehydrogenase
LPEEVAYRFLDLRHSGGAADHHNTVDVARRQRGIAQRTLDRSNRLRDEVGRDRREDLGSQRDIDLLARRKRRDNSGRRVQRQVFLRFARLQHQKPRVFGRQGWQRGSLDDPAINAVVEVVAAQC